MIGVVATACIVAVLLAQLAVLGRVAGDRRPARRTRPRRRLVTPLPGPAGRDPIGRLVAAVAPKRWFRRVLNLVPLAMVAVAVGLVGWPFYTNLYADRQQVRLQQQFESVELAQTYDTCREALEAGQADHPDCPQEGDSLTRIVIPRLGVDVVVVSGTGADALRAGAGHYRDTPLPCEAGNVSIAGHRTTYGRPFHDLDLLQPGDEITLVTPVGECTYAVGTPDVPTGQRIVAPTEISVIAPTENDQLTLTTCHPKGSARQRLILQATLVDVATPS